MKKFVIAAVALLSLGGCATLMQDIKEEITPERCVAMLEAADQVEDIAKFLITQGIEPELAAQVAVMVAQGRLAVQEVCTAVLAP